MPSIPRKIVKRGLGINVLEAAEARLRRVFDDFPRVYLSFSGGKDSAVMMHLACQEARRRGRRIGVLFVDLEAQYKMTIDHVEEMFALYSDVVVPYWLALPLNLRNAVSQYEPQWRCWDAAKKGAWVREPHYSSITDGDRYPWFFAGMEFEQLVMEFGHWYAGGKLCCCLVGIRCDESLNRWRSLMKRKSSYKHLPWTTWKSRSLYNAYPIYDWRVGDIWTYNGKTGLPYNRLYDRMHAAGLTPAQARICQPYGDDQRRGLWLFHVIEPETWALVVARVNGANQGALYVRERGNILGYGKVTKPDHLTWRGFAELILGSLPEKHADHYRDKISVFIRWYQVKEGYHEIPDEGPPNEKGKPSWTRICKVLLRGDYWCKGLSFTQTKPEAYEAYKRVMRNRRNAWNLM